MHLKSVNTRQGSFYIYHCTQESGFSFPYSLDSFSYNFHKIILHSILNTPSVTFLYLYPRILCAASCSCSEQHDLVCTNIIDINFKKINLQYLRHLITYIIHTLDVCTQVKIKKKLFHIDD